MAGEESGHWRIMAETGVMVCKRLIQLVKSRTVRATNEKKARSRKKPRVGNLYKAPITIDCHRA